MTNTTNNIELLYTRSQNPFNNQGENVFYSKGVVTFYTYDYILYENYKYGAFTDKNGEILKPGIYRDTEINEERCGNCFTVIVDHESPLIKALCEEKINEINDEYGTGFHHKIISTSYENLEDSGLVEVKQDLA